MSGSRWLMLGLALVLLVAGATPQLVVPHGRIGQSGTSGPAALWRDADTSFAIETSGDIENAVGTVQRRAVDIGADGAMTYGEQPAWDAALLLAAAPERQIFTSDPSGATIAFDWASLPEASRSLLDRPESGAPADGLGELRTAFLRGDRGRENGQPQGLFRKRAGVLGDVVNSAPLIVGAPPASIAGADHAAFRARFRERELAVYVGANDGMLHAFSAAGGAELFAYVPAALIQHLAALSGPAYTPRPYVDGSAGQGDVNIGGNWRTVLVSGMGMGARGVFALDITDPARFGQGQGALWEFTEADDPAIGHVREAPVIASVGIGKADKGDGAAARHVAIVSSGINTFADDGAGTLFLLALDKAAGQQWERGVNLFAIATESGDTAQVNALSPPALVLDGAGRAIRAYAGDLQGNLWRFDFDTLRAHRLFIAHDRSGARQPIAYAPKMVFAPGGGYLVVFGTGKLIEESDLLPASVRQQSLYAVLDSGAAPGPMVSRAQLAERTLTAGEADFAVMGERFDYFGPDAKKGWYFDFPGDGTRAAGSPASVGGAILIATMLSGPGKTTVDSRLYVLDALSGFAHAADGRPKPGAPTAQMTASNPTGPVLYLDFALDKGARNATGGATATRRVTLAGARAGAPPLTVDVRYRAGRLGWREVANWQELHHAAAKSR